MFKKRGQLNTIREVCLGNLGVSSTDDINAWYSKSSAGGYRISNLTAVSDYIKTFRGCKIMVIGDYDTDGITATYILVTALKKAGFTNVSYRIPHRFNEGYGISESIIDEINEGLIITCDNGIAGLAAIKKAKEKGLAVVVTDHHKPIVSDGKVILPDADYIVDPNAIEDSADFTDYCGAGLAYKLAVELLNHDRNQYLPLLPICAIGTVGDVVSLREENHVFVRNGLRLANRYPEILPAGLVELISIYGISGRITSADIGFKISPAFNAMSRMYGDAGVVVEFLCETDPLSAKTKAEEIAETNEARKSVKNDALKEALYYIEETRADEAFPIVVKLPDCSDGIIGIIAGNITEKFNAPSIVFTYNSEKAVWKGSGRSVDGYDLKEHLDRVSEHISKYGGHPKAAGLSVEESRLDAFITALHNTSSDYCHEEKERAYDLEIYMKDIPDAVTELKQFEPFGEGNRPPVFLVHGFSAIPVNGKFIQALGNDKNIVRIQGIGADAIAFDMSPEDINIADADSIELLGTLSENIFISPSNSEEILKYQIEFSDYEINAKKTVSTDMAERLKALARGR